MLVLFGVFLLAFGALRWWAGGQARRAERRAPSPPPPEPEPPEEERTSTVPPDPADVAARLLAAGPELVIGLREAGLAYEAARVEVLLTRIRRWLPHGAPGAAEPTGRELPELVEELRRAGLHDEATTLESSAGSQEAWLPDVE